MVSSFPSSFEGEGAGKITWRSSVPLSRNACFFLPCNQCPLLCGRTGQQSSSGRQIPDSWFARSSLCLRRRRLRYPLSCSSFPGNFRGKLLLRRLCYAMQNSFLVCYGRDGPEAEHGSRAKSDLTLGSNDIEIAWINDTPPTWHASCRCLEPDRTPRVNPCGAFG
jgi:hypothetical protein